MTTPSISLSSSNARLLSCPPNLVALMSLTAMAEMRGEYDLRVALARASTVYFTTFAPQLKADAIAVSRRWGGSYNNAASIRSAVDDDFALVLAALFYFRGSHRYAVGHLLWRPPGANVLARLPALVPGLSNGLAQSVVWYGR